MVKRWTETPERNIRAVPDPLENRRHLVIVRAIRAPRSSGGAFDSNVAIPCSHFAPLAEEFMRGICNSVYVGASPTRCS